MKQIGGQATIEEVFKASKLSIDDFWNMLKAEMESGWIERIKKGKLVFVKVKQ